MAEVLSTKKSRKIVVFGPLVLLYVALAAYGTYVMYTMSEAEASVFQKFTAYVSGATQIVLAFGVLFGAGILITNACKGIGKWIRAGK